MVEIVSKAANIGDYEAYLVEIAEGVELENEVTKALDENFEKVGAKLREDQVYIRTYDTEVYDALLRHLEMTLTEISLPPLAVLATHPDDLSADNRCILIEFGDAESRTAVTRKLDWLISQLQDDEFMRSLTWQRKKEMIEENMKRLGGPGQTMVSLITLI
jgi:hypothetical protein